jgi:rare lipoprotein A
LHNARANRQILISRLPLLAGSLLLGACGSLTTHDSAPNRYVDHTRVANAVPKVEPRSKYGNPDSYIVQGKRYTVRKTATGFQQRGIASWYGTKFHGHRTSSGEPYNMYAMTAAHKTLPIPSYVEVTNLDNHRKIVVRVNDRGPFHEGRIIDLSYVAAKKLGITATGTGRVEIRAIDPRAQQTASTAAVARPAKAVKTALAVTPPPTASQTAGQLYLQVGAFTDRNNAAQLLNRLLTATRENVLINRASAGDENIYRVRIGPLDSAADAQQLQTQLGPQFDRLGIQSPHVVVE